MAIYCVLVHLSLIVRLLRVNVKYFWKAWKWKFPISYRYCFVKTNSICFFFHDKIHKLFENNDDSWLIVWLISFFNCVDWLPFNLEVGKNCVRDNNIATLIVTNITFLCWKDNNVIALQTWRFYGEKVMISLYLRYQVAKLPLGCDDTRFLYICGYFYIKIHTSFSSTISIKL